MHRDNQSVENRIEKKRKKHGLTGQDTMSAGENKRG